MRKMRYSEKPNSMIKSGIGNIKTVTKANISYIQRQTLRPINLTAWAKFDEINFNGISILANLSDGLDNKVIGSCQVSVYSVAQGNSRNETLIGTKSGTYTPNGFVIDFLANELPDLEGDITIKVKVITTRQNKKYYFMGYFNHLGSIEFMNRNKRKITFLEVTKADE